MSKGQRILKRLQGGLDDRTFRIVFGKKYDFLMEDVGHTWNINFHSFQCYAMSFAEAYGTMLLERPEFIGVCIKSIHCNDRRMDLSPELRKLRVFSDCKNQKQWKAFEKRIAKLSAQSRLSREQERLQFNKKLQGAAN